MAETLKDKPEQGPEEDDYMSMPLADPDPPKLENSIQRQARRRREAELKAHVKSKSEVAAQEREAREKSLATSLDRSNKGFQMMEKLGFKGGGLGREGGRVEPIAVEMREGKGGIGLDAEKKRKVREEMEGEVKRVKAEEGDYRERLARERMERKVQGQIWGAMKVAERLHEEDLEGKRRREADEGGDKDGIGEEAAEKDGKHTAQKLTEVNLLWRNLVRDRAEKDRNKRMRYDLDQSLYGLPTHNDPDEDKDYKIALGTEEPELEEEDPELDDFNALEPEVRLARIVEHMRHDHLYCFWCKASYSDASMEGCPGETEDDHD